VANNILKEMFPSLRIFYGLPIFFPICPSTKPLCTVGVFIFRVTFGTEMQGRQKVAKFSFSQCISSLLQLISCSLCISSLLQIYYTPGINILPCLEVLASKMLKIIDWLILNFLRSSRTHLAHIFPIQMVFKFFCVN